MGSVYDVDTRTWVHFEKANVWVRPERISAVTIEASPYVPTDEKQNWRVVIHGQGLSPALLAQEGLIVDAFADEAAAQQRAAEIVALLGG